MSRMLKVNTLWLLLSMIMSWPLAGAVEPPRVTLTITPSTTLPGLSVPLALRITAGSSPLRISEAFRVRVTPSNGEPFLADWGRGRDLGFLDGYSSDGGPILVRAGGTHELVIPAVDLSRLSWALDQRLLTMPGSYVIEVYLYAHKKTESDEQPVPLAVSSSATLKIATPEESDTHIWEAIQRKKYWGIAERVAAESQTSQYFPYLVSLSARGSYVDKAEAMSRALQQHPSSPLVPWLLAGIARMYASAAQEVFDVEDDIDAAVEYSAKARAYLLRLGESSNAWAKAKAKHELERLPGQKEYLEMRLRRQIHGRVQHE